MLDVARGECLPLVLVEDGGGLGSQAPLLRRQARVGLGALRPVQADGQKHLRTKYRQSRISLFSKIGAMTGLESDALRTC